MNIMRFDPTFKLRHTQSGSTLIISLIILILLMLLGVTAMKTSDTQFQLAGNLQFEDSAMNNAETAINAAETAMAKGTIARADTGFTTAYVSANGPVTAGLYPISSGIDPLTLDWAGAGGNGNNYSIQVTGSQNYIIELMSTNNRLVGSSQTTGGRSSSGCNQVNTYRITARGTSARGATKFIQSFYSVLSC
jgi:type IV pilus assembly protein PilX